MSGAAVQFGAGNIGRGFLAQLFTESGLEVIFVDVAAEMVDALNSRRRYSIHIVGDAPETVTVSNVRAIHGADRERVTEEIARASVVCTAVGAGALPHIAPTLASGLLARHKAGGGPVNVLALRRGPTIAELAALGVRRVSTGGGLARAAYGALMAGARELMGRGTSSYLDTAVSDENLDAALRAGDVT